MKIMRLLIALLFLPLVVVEAQEPEPAEGTRIVSAVVSGADLSHLSPALQADIGKLAGSALNRQLLREIAARIEAEHPRHVVGVRASLDPGGGTRVVFVVARVRGDAPQANINARYVVEGVHIRGVPADDISQTLRADLDSLAGRPLDTEEADRLEGRLKGELPHYDVSRRTVKGRQPGHVELIFDARRAEWSRWLRFEPVEANALYHSDQGWGAKLPITIGGRDFHVTPVVAIDIGDELVEEYSGFEIRAEARKIVTERLGAYFEWSTFDQTWRESTLTALAARPGLPSAYGNRMTLTPIVKVAITPQLTVGGGVRIVELDPLSGLDPAQMANAVLGSVSFAAQSRPGSDPRHDVEAAFTVGTGTRALESDFTYERYVGRADYLYRFARHEVRVSGMVGGISGDAPLFERFTLGDSRTLRGWNKYDIAPAGADRMFHASLEYRYAGLGIFLDTGSVWDEGADCRVRASTGVTFNPGPVFFTVGFAVNTDEFRAVFTAGIRFPGSSVAIKKY